MASSEWSERKISLAGIELPIVTAGQGKPLLVLHDEFGYPGWFRWQSALGRERTLIIPMAPGFGRAPRIEWIESTRDLAGVYSRMLREEGLRSRPDGHRQTASEPSRSSTLFTRSLVSDTSTSMAQALTTPLVDYCEGAASAPLDCDGGRTWESAHDGHSLFR